MQEEIQTRKLKSCFDFDCSICLSEVEVPVVTLCGHLFCWGCLYGWGTKSNICPVCKKACSLSSVIPIYSKGASSAPAAFPKPPLPTALCPKSTGSHMVGIQYNERMRIFHMEGVEYRRGIYNKHCFFTKIFYVVVLLFCIGVFLLLD
ncbi:E3 ubiquitin-protein ligase RNF5 [Nematocida sp. AWRm77]|nr:E3 ubiquitin-protein ligase RNF5 [Nematocida sp. AWRm77]